MGIGDDNGTSSQWLEPAALIRFGFLAALILCGYLSGCTA